MNFSARKVLLTPYKVNVRLFIGEPGCGAGKGGGGGGAIREAGGSFGKMEALREDEYFHRKEKEQLKELKKLVEKEIQFRQEQIRHHEDAIRRHKQALDKSGQEIEKSFL